MCDAFVLFSCHWVYCCITLFVLSFVRYKEDRRLFRVTTHEGACAMINDALTRGGSICESVVSCVHERSMFKHETIMPVVLFLIKS